MKITPKSLGFDVVELKIILSNLPNDHHNFEQFIEDKYKFKCSSQKYSRVNHTFFLHRIQSLYLILRAGIVVVIKNEWT